MRSYGTFIGLTLVVGLLLYGVFGRLVGGGALAPYTKGELAELKPALRTRPTPQLVVQDKMGQDRTLASLMVAPITVVNLWASWCAPCVAELPSLNRLALAYPGRVEVLTINIDESKAEADIFLRQHAPNVQTFFDASKASLRLLEAHGIPLTVIYDKAGHEIARISGGVDWMGADAQRLFNGLLADQEKSISPKPKGRI